MIKLFGHMETIFLDVSISFKTCKEYDRKYYFSSFFQIDIHIQKSLKNIHINMELYMGILYKKQNNIKNKIFFKSFSSFSNL